ncbi:hypothetical protein LARI1_G001965 [Lachnellula arida]|uniref:Alternative oxidase n=1 Tax=Lachnellula arida TaxID=1316785 RepID=A0A8T9BLY7_9HELO|nr:hypothetical protein LARI1_G001965 [Lachnellula arida]
MDLPAAGVNKRYASLAGFILFAVWFWVLFDRPYRFPSHVPWNIYSNGPQAPPTTDLFKYPLVDSSAIKTVCAKRPFDESITFICEDSPGDVAEVRNSILNCVRYAIAVGANIVLPQIVMREDYDKENNGNRTDLSYMFDTAHFVASLGALCPNMRIYATSEEVLHVKHLFGPIPLAPETFAKSPLTPPEDWHTAFKEWLAQHIDPLIVQPIVVELGRSFLQYPVAMEEEEFANSFSKLLNFHSDIRNLAVMTLLNIARSFALWLDPEKSILKDRYFGIHLTTSQDAEAASATIDQTYYQYPMQSKLFLDQAVNSEMSLLYVSSDDDADLVRFISDAQALNFTVTTKFDLLKGWDRETLLELTPEQRAMIDYLVHSKASQFAGVGHSSFSWNIALQRRQFSEQKDCFGGPEMLSDDLSQIYGTPNGRPEYPASMWP